MKKYLFSLLLACLLLASFSLPASATVKQYSKTDDSGNVKITVKYESYKENGTKKVRKGSFVSAKAASSNGSSYTLKSKSMKLIDSGRTYAVTCKGTYMYPAPFGTSGITTYKTIKDYKAHTEFYYKK